VTRAIARSEKESYILVQFAYGASAGSLASYTDLERDVTPYMSTPLLEVELPDNVGTFQEKECRIVLPRDAFTDRFLDAPAQDPVYVRVEQQIRGLTAGEAGSNLIPFKGRVERIIHNYQRRPGLVAFQALLVRDRLDVPLGLQMNHHDEARIFGPMSGLVQASHQQTGQIAVIDGKEITISTPRAVITNPTAPGGDNSRFWERGWLEKDGARIGIHIWTIADPSVFVLRERPPASWLLAGAASILFVPGSHGTIEDARDVWDDEEHFLGYGYATPSYNPIINVKGTRS
jgi:hypothetical protein